MAPNVQIAGRLRRIWPDHPERYMSHKTIDLAIYAYPRGELKRQLISHLRRPPCSRTQGKRPIGANPAENHGARPRQ